MADADIAVCDYCGVTVLIDDEITRIEYTNAAEAGYHFEKGRLRAQAEQPHQYATPQKRKRYVFWLVVAWIFFFPIPATILILRKKNMHWLLKTFLILITWGIYLAFVLFSGANA